MERRGFLGLLPFLPFAFKSPQNETQSKVLIIPEATVDKSGIKVAKHIIIKGDDGNDYNVLVTKKESNTFAKLEMPKFEIPNFAIKSSQGLT